MLELERIQEITMKDGGEPVWEHPDNSKWVLGVDQWGAVFVVEAPNIHPAFLEERNAEMIGLPCELDIEPGLYSVVCSYYESRDWESGAVDDWGFDIETMEKMQ